LNCEPGIRDLQYSAVYSSASVEKDKVIGLTSGFRIMTMRHPTQQFDKASFAYKANTGIGTSTVFTLFVAV
jgi:hypothetical protein